MTSVYEGEFVFPAGVTLLTLVQVLRWCRRYAGAGVTLLRCYASAGVTLVQALHK